MLLQPFNRHARVAIAQVHDQVDRAATALLQMPVEEFAAGDRNGTTFGVPAIPIEPVTVRSALGQHISQWD
jgi:hypothetical protein